MKEKIINRLTPFTDLVKPENLKKINISEELVPHFVNVMKKFQEYFEKKGLLGATNLALLFEEYLLEDGKDKFTIEVAEVKLANAGGLYIPQEKKIQVNKKVFEIYVNEYPMEIEGIIAHEFIHFIAMTDLPWIETKNGDFVQFENYFQEHFVRGGFITEGFTQLLTEQMYPELIAYYAYTSMVKMYLSAFSTEDFFSFLRGRLPGKTYHSDKVTKFMTFAEKVFWFKYESKEPISWEEEIAHPYYQEAFNLLVDAFKEKVGFEIERFEFAGVLDFAERIYNFKSSMIFKSTYFDSAVNGLVTDFVSKYYRSVDTVTQFEIKKEIEDIIFDKMGHIKHPEFEGEYRIVPDNSANYYCHVKSFKNEVLLESYSPDGILLRSDKISKQFKGFAGFTVNKAMAADEVHVDFEIIENQLKMMLYHHTIGNLSEKEYNELPEEQLPILFTIPLENEEAKQEAKQVREETYQVCEELDSLIDPFSIITMKILKEDPRVVNIVEVKDIYPSGKSSVYLSISDDNNFKFYYVSGSNYVELKMPSKYTTIIPVDKDVNIHLNVKASSETLSVYKSDGIVGKKEECDLEFKYFASKSYYDNIKEKEDYKKYISYDDEKEFDN